jgi:hypothetical protein
MSFDRKGRGKSGHRPNAKSIHGTGSANVFDRCENLTKRNGKICFRTTIQDLCDYCLPNKKLIRVKRYAMRLRLKGFKFACADCATRLKKENGALKEQKVIAETFFYSYNWKNKS